MKTKILLLLQQFFMLLTGKFSQKEAVFAYQPLSQIKINKMKPFFFSISMMFLFFSAAAQDAVNDYRSNATGNWNSTATWQRCSVAGNPGTWVAATAYPGQSGTTLKVTIRDGNTVTMNQSPAQPIAALVVGEGTSGILKTDNSSARTLTVSGSVSIAAGGSYNSNTTGSNVTNVLNVGGDFTNNGTFDGFASATKVINVNMNGSVAQTISGSGSTFRFYVLTIANTANTISLNNNINVLSALTVNSNATFAPDATVVINSAAAAGTISGSGTIHVSRVTTTADYANQYKFSTNTLTSLTVDYNGAGNQTINSTFGTYGALSTRTSGIKTLQGNINVSNALAVYAGSTLALSNFTLGATTDPNSLFMECGAVVGSQITGTGALTLGGNATISNNGGGTSGAVIFCPIVLSSNRTFTVADDGTDAEDLLISGIISGINNNLTKAGTGLMTLSGINTYTGVTTLSGGILSVSVINNGSVAGNLGAASTNGGNMVFGAGTLRYTGVNASTNRSFSLTSTTNTTFDITTNILTISGIISNNNALLTKIGSGTLLLSGANTYGGLTTISEGTLQYGIANALSNGPVTVNGGTYNIASFSDAVGAVTLIDGSIIGTTGVLTGTSYAMQNGTVSAILAGSVALTKTTSGTVIMSGTNTYTGVTTISAGVLSVAIIGNGGVAGNMGAASTTASNLVLSGGTLEYTGATASTNRNFILSNGTTSTFDITANELTFTGASTSTSGALTKTGAGTLTLSGSNLYTGITNITAGTLKMGGSERISNSSAMVADGTLDLNGFNLTIASLSGSGTVTSNSAGSPVFTVNGSSSTNYSGVIQNGSGSVSLIKLGSSTLTLSGANSHTGGLTLSAGALTLGASGVLADALPVIYNGGTFNTAGFSETAGTMQLSNNSIINLTATPHNLVFAASNAIGWTAARTLTINGWTGAYNGTAGTNGRMYVGGAPGNGLTAGQLSQIQFFNGTSNIPAIMLADGEVVPSTVAPSALSYNTPNVFAVGTAITALNPSVTGVIDSYSISPALPSGLNFNTVSGAISGTPSSVSANSTYTVTATNAGGNTTFDLDIVVIAAQASTDNFRSRVTGTWATAATWERSPAADGVNWATATAAPTSSTANTITVRNGHTVTISATLSIDQVTVDATGRIDFASGTLTIANGPGDDLVVSGKFYKTSTSTITTTGNIVFNSGSEYHDDVAVTSTIPTASWDVNSTCFIDEWTSSTDLKNNLAGQTFGNFTIAHTTGSATANLLPSGGTMTVAGNFTYSASGRTIALISSTSSATTLGIAGNFIMTTGTFTVNGGGTGLVKLNVAGDFNKSGGTFTAGASTVTFNGGNQIITGTTTAFNTLTILSGSTVTANTIVTATIANINNGGKYIQTTGSAIIGSTTKNFVPGSTYEIQTAGVSFSGSTYGNLIIDFPGSSSLQMNGVLTTVANDLTVFGTGTAALRFANGQNNTINIAGNLIISGGNLEGSSGSGDPIINVAGDLLLSAGNLKLTTSSGTPQLNVTGNILLNGGTFQPMTSTGLPSISVKGDWIKNGGTYIPGSVTVTFNGTLAQKILGNSATAFGSLTLNNASGLTLQGSLNTSVAGILTLTNGLFNTQSNILQVTNTATGAVVRTNGYVNGNLQRAIATGTNSYAYHVGTATGYTPATFAMTSVNTGGNMVVTSNNGASSNYPSSLSAVKKVDRHWMVTNNGVAGFTANATFTFLPADLVGGAVFSNLKAYKYNGSYSFPAAYASTANTFSYNGLTSFSEFGAGECEPIIVDPTTGGPGSMCVSTTVQLSNLTPDGVWSSDNASIASVNVNGLVTANAAGTTNIRYTVTEPGGSACSGEATPVSITVIANSTITRTSGAGTDAQTKCINNALTTITYSIGGSGTGASITAGGLPTGVTGSFNTGVFTISGTPTQSGNFSYTVTTTGPCVNNSANGTITVNPDAAIALTSGAGSNAQSVCNSTAVQSITYAISGGGTGAGVTGLPPGVNALYNAGVLTISGTATGAGVYNYTVTTTGGGCLQAVANGSITINTPPTATFTKTNMSVCGGSNDGEIFITPSGGTAPYSFSWTGVSGPGGHTPFTAGNVSSLSGLNVGYYNVIVTDDKGCTFSINGIHIAYAFSVYITNSGSISSGCGNTGSIILYGNAGVQPYAYALDLLPYQSGNTFTNLAAGSHTAYIKDDAGCVSTKIIFVDAAPPIVVNGFTRAASSCSNDGSIELYRSGGIPPYQHSLDGITYQASHVFSSRAAGNYTGYVKDSKGCVGVQSLTITQGANLSVNANKTNTSTCVNDGSFQLIPVGGVGPYTYSKDDITYGSINSFTGLAQGNYIGWVKDSKGCKGSKVVMIDYNTINVTSYASSASGCASNNGSIQLFRTGGVGPYTYSLGGNDYQSSPVFNGLVPGIYDGFVKDSKTCLGAMLNIVVGPACGPVAPGGTFTKGLQPANNISESAGLKINAYPNPAQGAFTVVTEATGRKNVTLIVTDLLGRKVYQTTGAAGQQFKFGEQFNSGIYLLQVLQGTEKKTMKLIKE